jgi:hypothetical protein
MRYTGSLFTFCLQQDWQAPKTRPLSSTVKKDCPGNNLKSATNSFATQQVVQSFRKKKKEKEKKRHSTDSQFFLAYMLPRWRTCYN